MFLVFGVRFLGCLGFRRFFQASRLGFCDVWPGLLVVDVFVIAPNLAFP